jgi:Ca2+-binding EF-hand superfamily protein
MTGSVAPLHSNFTPARGLQVVDFVCRKMQKQMASDVSLGGSWFKLFLKYDRDSSGMVDFGELEHVLRREVKIRKTEISDEELKLLWATFDADGSGFVTIKEFSGFMRRYQHFGKAAFAGKVPITPMANIKDLSKAILDAGRELMKEQDTLNIEEVASIFQGTEYEQFASWLSANHGRYDDDGNGKIEMHELEHAIFEFQLEMERDKARLTVGKPLAGSASMGNLTGAFGDTNSLTKSSSLASLRDPPGYCTIAGYSSIKREGAIMGNVPLRASDWEPVAEKLRIDFETKREFRDRYEDTTFTGAPATSLTKLPLESYRAGAHMHNFVSTRWGGVRSRNSKPILIKGSILPPEEKKFLEQVRESHKPSFWPQPMQNDLHWCQRLSAIPTMSSVIRTQNKYEELTSKIKHF